VSKSGTAAEEEIKICDINYRSLNLKEAQGMLGSTFK